MNKIELFKTKCKFEDGSTGEVCKKLTNGYLVCNNKLWYECSKEWIIKNRIK